MRKLIIIGAGGHGRVVFDIAVAMGVYEKIFFLDDYATSDTEKLIEVEGKISDYKKYISDDLTDIIVAIGNGRVREQIFLEIVQSGASVPTLIHPSAVIGGNVKIGCGSVVMAGAVINNAVNIGQGAIINTCASVDHDCTIAEFTHVSVGSHICGTVNIGKQVWIGAGATVINNINICDDVFIGAGAVVVKDIDAGGTYIGVPAMLMK